MLNLLNLPSSTTYKYLDVLLGKGFLSKDPDSRNFFLGFEIPKMVDLVPIKTRLIDVAWPHIVSLSKLSRETVTLTVIHGWEALCIEKIESSKMMRLTVEWGSNIPLHAGAG